MSSPQIGYLLLVHKSPRLVGRLIDRLDDCVDSIYIHVDGRADVNEFISAAPAGPNVTFLQERYETYWASFRIVLATLALLRRGLLDDRALSHFILLSGNCYPIKDRTIIRNRLQRTTDNFVSVERVKQASRWSFKNLRWLNHTVPKGSVVDRIFATLLSRAVSATRFDTRRRRLPEDFTYYQGSQWWCIRRELAEYLMHFVRDKWRLISFMKFMHAPDEVLVQSIAKHSQYAPTISHDFQTGSWPSGTHVAALHYIDRSVGGGHPRILSERDFERLKFSEALFARKVNEDQSTALMNRIDRELL